MECPNLGNIILGSQLQKSQILARVKASSIYNILRETNTHFENTLRILCNIPEETDKYTLLLCYLKRVLISSPYVNCKEEELQNMVQFCSAFEPESDNVTQLQKNYEVGRGATMLN